MEGLQVGQIVYTRLKGSRALVEEVQADEKTLALYGEPVARIALWKRAGGGRYRETMVLGASCLLEQKPCRSRP